MDKLIPFLYGRYGRYVNHSRAFPLDVDGLKPVERRILLSAYEVCRDHYVKSAKVDGNTIAKYHPHSSCYGTIVQLVHQGFLDGQGNFGSDVGVDECPPAAMRYTECRMSKEVLKLVFSLIDYVDWKESELDDEPEFLPTMYPLCLLGNNYTEGIGFGFKTLIPCYKIEDLHKRLLFLLGIEKEEPIIKPISKCNIVSTDLELKQLLTTGKAAIKFEGIYEVDKKNYKVTVRSWPSNRNFESILNKLSKHLDTSDVGFNDLSSSETNIVFEINKQRNREEIFTSFLKSLKPSLSGSISFDINVVTRDRVIKNISVDELLLNTFNIYKTIYLKMLNSKKSKCLEFLDECRLIEKIKPSLAKNMKQVENIDETVEKISSDSKVAVEIVKAIITKYRIVKLLTTKFDHQSIQTEIDDFDNKINNLDKVVISDYKQISTNATKI